MKSLGPVPLGDFVGFVPVDPVAATGRERDGAVRFGADGDELAQFGGAGVAAEVLQGARVGGGNGEADFAARAVDRAGGPELAVAGEADRARALAVERRPQRLAEAERGPRG